MKLLTPKEAMPILGIGSTSLSRLVALGAPVHRYGPTGFRYRIDVDEFREWMEHRGDDQHLARVERPGSGGRQLDLSAAQMAKRRKDMIAALA